MDSEALVFGCATAHGHLRATPSRRPAGELLAPGGTVTGEAATP
ncbi:hypothetical protein SCOCK_30266 [Actinacidiphila cocklensis]|uniref:Uncharacterized protein n=1 Tax=Actinacidiphila cocklensis TaxID=887465 RepID=A0A9W4DP41_9ACTN|nr:hypothetical protein SCOCK_30266 [Actinacidiphila cocklensis]